MIGTPYTEGPKLMRQVEEHINEYKVDVMKGQRAKDIRRNDVIEVELENGAVLKTKTAILSNRCSLAQHQCSGRKEFKNKGVALLSTL